MEEHEVSPASSKLLGISFALSEEKDGVILELSAETGNLQRFRPIAQLCREKIPLLLPGDNQCEIDFIHTEPERVVEIGDDVHEDQLFKVALMGAVGSGKTLLAKRFAHNIYSQHVKATIGVDFVKKNIMVGTTRCKLQIWDLAGTRPQDDMTRMYLRETSGILLTTNISRQGSGAIDDVLSTYEKILRDTEFPNIPIMIVGLQSDIGCRESVEKLEVLADQLHIPVMLCSAKTGENVNAVFDVLSRMMLTKQLPRYVMQLDLKGVCEASINTPDFYAKLDHLISADASVMPMIKVYDMRLAQYDGAVKGLNEKCRQMDLLRFYIKNLDCLNAEICRDAAKNVKNMQRQLPTVIELFHRDLLKENHAVRYEAIHGLRVLGELNTERVKNRCFRQFNHIAFESTYSINTVIEKLKEYKQPELVRNCIRAISFCHVDYFSILEEIGAKQECEDISIRVLQLLDAHLKQLATATCPSAGRAFRYGRHY